MIFLIVLHSTPRLSRPVPRARLQLHTLTLSNKGIVLLCLLHSVRQPDAAQRGAAAEVGERRPPEALQLAALLALCLRLLLQRREHVTIEQVQLEHQLREALQVELAGAGGVHLREDALQLVLAVAAPAGLLLRVGIAGAEAPELR